MRNIDIGFLRFVVNLDRLAIKDSQTNKHVNWKSGFLSMTNNTAGVQS